MLRVGRGKRETPLVSALNIALELGAVILEEAKVALVPGEGFGAPGYVRFSYALGDDDIAEGIGRIADLLG